MTPEPMTRDQKRKAATVRNYRDRQDRIEEMRQESRESLRSPTTTPPARVMTPEQVAEAAEMLPKMMDQVVKATGDLVTTLTLVSEVMIAIRETITAWEEKADPNLPQDPALSPNPAATVVPMRKKAT